MSLQLTIACGDYDRTHPLIDGSVKPEGLELNWLVLPHLEIWTRMLNYYDFDASEISLSSYLITRTIGKPLTTIPVFPATITVLPQAQLQLNYFLQQTVIGDDPFTPQIEPSGRTNPRPSVNAANAATSSPPRPPAAIQIARPNTTSSISSV